jgi:hypothetical protein
MQTPKMSRRTLLVAGVTATATATAAVGFGVPNGDTVAAG